MGDPPPRRAGGNADKSTAELPPRDPPGFLRSPLRWMDDAPNDPFVDRHFREPRVMPSGSRSGRSTPMTSPMSGHERSTQDQPQFPPPPLPPPCGHPKGPSSQRGGMTPRMVWALAAGGFAVIAWPILYIALGLFLVVSGRVFILGFVVICAAVILYIVWERRRSSSRPLVQRPPHE